MSAEDALTIRLCQITIGKLKASAPIKAFVLAKFAKKHTVILGSEGGAEPAQEDYPVIEIGEIEGVGKGESGNPTYSCAVTMGIVSTTKTVDDAVDYKTIEYDGLKLVEKFRELVESEILDIKGIGAKIFLSGKTLLENYHPIFKSSTEVFFEVPRSTAGGRS